MSKKIFQTMNIIVIIVAAYKLLTSLRLPIVASGDNFYLIAFTVPVSYKYVYLFFLGLVFLIPSIRFYVSLKQKEIEPICFLMMSIFLVIALGSIYI
jgi:hypothetical protein